MTRGDRPFLWALAILGGGNGPPFSKRGGNVEETLFMIKPDAVEGRKVGLILREVEKAGFEIVSMRLTRLITAAIPRTLITTESATAVTSSARAPARVISPADPVWRCCRRYRPWDLRRPSRQ